MSHSERGFTLLELTIVFGLLTGFLVFLTQIMSSGVELFDEGESGQELADIGNAASATVTETLSDLVGPEREAYEPGEPDARVLVQWVPLGLNSDDKAATRVQAIRGTARLAPAEETALLRSSLRQAAAEMEGSLEPDAVAARLTELVAAAPRRGRSELLFLPWPAGDPDGAFLELRAAELLPGHRIQIDRRRDVGLLEVDHLDQGPLGAAQVLSLTEPVASGLLHFEVQLWSQYTRSFADVGEGRPEWVWDSARAGLLSPEEGEPRETFTLDLFPESLRNPTDDVYPRRARVLLVVAREGPQARLGEALGEGESSMRLLTTDPLPDLDETPFLKIGPEWVRHGGATGNVLTGLRRGQRGTSARSHARGTIVRAGKTIVLHLELQFGRDNWNG